MANIQKCVTGTEATGDALVAIVRKALGYPQRGQHIGGGRHVDMPQSWDGQGPTPPGWTKQPTAVWVTSATDAAVPISDELASELQKPEAQGRLSAGDITTLTAALLARANKDLETGYSPKANGAGVGGGTAAPKDSSA